MFGDMIIHEKVQVTHYGISIPIRAFLDVFEMDIHRFSLLYRPYGNIEYVEAPMIQMGKSIYFSEIPGEFIIRDYLEYYLLLEMSNKTNFFSPVDDAVQNPIRINIDISEKEVVIKNIDVPQLGVRGRNSDNTLIKEKLGWSPTQPLRVGIEKTYKWIKEQI